ncbi:MAG: hypothetical protein WCY82_10350 [Desulfotomaculaceae bacterium]
MKRNAALTKEIKPIITDKELEDAEQQSADAGDFGFDILYQTPEEGREALKDLVLLAGVMKDLAAEKFWVETAQVLDTLRTFELIRRSTFYDNDAVQGEDELVYRFKKVYSAEASIDIPRLIRLGRRYNWVNASNNPPLKFTNTGKRMVNHLFRIANDSLFYYRQNPVLREIYQARRDLDLARAYEDMGIGRHDTVASVLHNLENAVNDLRYQREKYIQDRRALEKYQAVRDLLEMLETELQERLKKAQGFTDRLLEYQNQRSATLFYRVIQELSALLGENAYISQMQVGRKILRVDRDKFLDYLINAYSGTLDGMTLSPMKILEYMESGVYDQADEDASGLWLPITLPFLLHDDDICRGGNQLEHWLKEWQPPQDDDGLEDNVEYRAARQVTQAELASLVGRSTSIVEELNTDTQPMVRAIHENPGASVAWLVNNLGDKWGEAVRQLFTLGFLVTAGEARTFKHPGSDSKEIARQYRWKIGYPEDGVRYIKGTAKLGWHLENDGARRVDTLADSGSDKKGGITVGEP